MKRETMICDKCEAEILCQGSRIEILEEAFKFKVIPVDLCVSCTRELLKWLKGEPVPKQTIT